MFQRIKRLFAKEDDADEALLAIDSKDWRKGFISILSEKQDSRQPQLLAQINAELFILKERADELLKAEIASANIDKRLLEKIHDSQVNYVRNAKLFADLSFINEEKAIFHIREVYKNFVKKTQQFSSDTSNTYFSLKDTFPHQMNQLTDSIRKVSALHKELYETTKDGIGKDFEEVKAKTRQFYEDINEERQLKSNLLIAKKELLESEQKLIALEKKKDTLKYAHDFKYISEDYERCEEITKKMHDLNLEIKTTISREEDLLIRMIPFSSHEKAIRKYTDDPVAAILFDDSLEIGLVLEELKEALKDKKIECEAKRRMKAISSIERIQKHGFLAHWKKTHDDLFRERRLVEDKIKRMPIMMNLSEADYQIEHLKAKIDKRRYFLEHAEERFNELNLLSRKEMLEKDLKDFSGKKIILT